MKYVVFIWLLYLSSLMALPCADASVHDDEHGYEQQHHHTGDPDNDGCSPFCFCHCCQGHITVSYLFYELSMVERPEIANTIHINPIPDTPVVTFFHPPRS